MMNWIDLLTPKRDQHNKSDMAGDALRSPFEMDYDRVIFSHPFRRLQDKTQVHPLPEEDFVHTRLTHSLEVSVVGRSLGKRVGQVVIERHPELKKQHYSFHDFGAIVAAASLAHDIGNPPFGHAGESAISDFFLHHTESERFKRIVSAREWSDLTHFEGNAQGLRILSNKQYQGLKLTFATLAAFTKYPRESQITSVEKGRRSQKKFGFFQTEKEIFSAIANELGLQQVSTNEEDYAWCRHPLAFLVEAADDICYGIIDLEDGCRLGLVSLEETVEMLAGIVGDRFDRDKFEQIGSKEEKIGLLRALAISQLIDECCVAFLDNEEGMMDATFDQALTDVIPSAARLKEISRLSFAKIYSARNVLETEVVGYEVLPGLLEVITGAVYGRYIEQWGNSGKNNSIFKLLPDTLVLEMDQCAG
ncbi:MAG: dNTP triphosphohydrolase, partial [Cyclobacteriaceae bacterium]|nr:dNTP triphosphohydrolase [Cyclobacteriaceae bacterium]